MDHLPLDPGPGGIVPLAEQHFGLLCLSIEKAYGLHMGQSGRLLLDFKLSPGAENGRLPKIRPLNGKSYIVDSSYLLPCASYLYFDPHGNAELPLLAEYDGDSHRFVAMSRRLIENQNALCGGTIIPVARLSSLRGVHYVKDCVCLQLMQIDFDRLYQANPELAEELRQGLWSKYNRFYDFDNILERSDSYQAAAQKYLEG